MPLLVPRTPAIGRAALAVALACGAAAQDAPGPPAPAAPAPVSAPARGAVPIPDPGPDTPAGEGLALLSAAATFQRGDRPLARPDSLHGSFHVAVRDETGSMIQASAERWYTAAPERLLTSRTESVTQSRSTVGFDGVRAWFRDDVTGKVIDYTDAPDTYDVDLDLLHEQLRLTRLLLDVSVLDALLPRLQGVAAAGRGSHEDPDGEVHAVRHVTARVPDELYPLPDAAPADPDRPALLELDFAVDVETGALWSLRVTAVGRPDVPALELRFAFHGRTRSGLRVPGNIKLFRDGETRESVRLGIVEQDGLLLFDLGEPIDPALFAPPEG